MTAAGSSKKKTVSSDGGKSVTVVVKRTILATIVASAGTEIVVTQEGITGHNTARSHARGWAQALELLENLVAH